MKLDPIPTPADQSLDLSDYPRPSAPLLAEFQKAVNRIVGFQLPILQIPSGALLAFEPSQIGSIVGALMDACIPQLDKVLPTDEFEEIGGHGLSKHAGILGEREGYPDYLHDSGVRAELKLLYVNPPAELIVKSPPTQKEPSARLTQKVTLKNIEPDRDVLLVLAYQLQSRRDNPDLVSPTIIDAGVFPVIDCVIARDRRLVQGGGGWVGFYETPVVLSKVGMEKVARSIVLDEKARYGRKESEGKDYNEDTNFGKLKRIPDPALKAFLKKHR